MLKQGIYIKELWVDLQQIAWPGQEQVDLQLQAGAIC